MRNTFCRVLSVLLLLTAMLVALEWFRSGSHWDEVSIGAAGRMVSLASEPGQVCLALFVSPPGLPDTRLPRISCHSEKVSGDNFWVDARIRNGFGWRLLGVGYAYQSSGAQATRVFFVPHWLIGVMLSAYPLLRSWRRWRSRPCSYPACAKCGYNLTGNVSGVCPECGEKIVPKRQA